MQFVLYYSCSHIIGLDKKRFWIFESFILLTFVVASGVVKLRWSQLERNTVKQIERRLATGY
jgi:hypothetical protein